VYTPRLREWRETRGATQAMLSESSGISEHTISRIEHGAPLRPTTARKLADALGVEIADLMESPPVLLGKAKALDVDLEGISDIEELRQIARDLKAEWNRIGMVVHDRALAGTLPRETHLEMLGRMEEIEGAILAARERAQELREKLDEYEAEGVFELTAS
jgi:transcriptional regulator with XRE-family HTH domain